MNIKRTSFIPDATIQAAEAGNTISDSILMCKIEEFEGHLLVAFGLAPEYWDFVIQALHTSGTLSGKALAQSMTHAVNELLEA